jgi:hypothetical protein
VRFSVLNGDPLANAASVLKVTTAVSSPPTRPAFSDDQSGRRAAQAGAPQIVIVQNWLEELKRLVPVD